MSSEASWFGRLLKGPGPGRWCLAVPEGEIVLEFPGSASPSREGAWVRIHGSVGESAGLPLVHVEDFEEVAPGEMAVLADLGNGPERMIRQPAARARIVQRARFFRLVREFFDCRGFYEVETPCLVPAAGTDPEIEAFSVDGGPAGIRYLHTSPELAMKRWIAAGVAPIFQIARAFRRGDLSALHSPEFTMVEWYRTDTDYRTVMEDVEALLFELLGDRFGYAGRTFHVVRPIPRVTMREAFERATGVDLADSPDAPRLVAALRERGFSLGSDLSYEAVFFRMIVERLEPWLAAHDLVFLVDYPAPVASLARLVPSDRRFAERFELFVAGMEIANGYTELTDSGEQARRFENDRRLRAQRGRSVPPVPDAFLTSLRLGLPPCAGVSVGLDRLLMLREDVQDVAELLPFPWRRAGSMPPYQPLLPPEAGDEEIDNDE